ncbi:hypothetical protein F443_23148 [Phytophthora nicotianae P1569]|uniref:Uncharacterized protein n=1 Tax=Phytophthora nicotianae P1569 TaxID=1317065 RepID=V9DSU5_PHYNI|nr:hypothetical protein F443_23148 [Phytophthora nicotianae P1569]
MYSMKLRSHQNQCSIVNFEVQASSMRTTSEFNSSGNTMR